MKEWAMKKGSDAKSVKRKGLTRTQMDLSDLEKRRDEFSMLVGTIPYGELGTGARCKAKKCSQPVYDKKSGLCSYHRMNEAQRMFEDNLRARQQQARGEG